MNYEGPARWTGIPKDQYAQIGESASFFCEGFIDDPHTKIRTTYKATLILLLVFSAVTVLVTLSTVKWHLEIRLFLKDRFGKLEKDGPFRPLCEGLKWRSMMKIECLAEEVQSCDGQWKRDRKQLDSNGDECVHSEIVSPVKTYLTIAGLVRLKFSDNEKEYDAFVCYDQDDTDFALGVLVPTLERKYHYHCFAYERDCNAGDIIPETYSTNVNISRRFIMVLSPSLARNKWCTYALYMAIEAMLNLHSKIICIILQDIVWTQDEISDDTTLQQVLRVVKKVRWTDDPVNTDSVPINITDSPVLQRAPSLTDSSSDILKQTILKQTPSSPGSAKFWTSLRVLLPPRRPVQLRKSVPLTVIESSTASVLN
uniref:TIR domain-containing protein n=1 Tax=Timema genevievae TaxID=629358 RepID=A0A7R9PRE3_TIMGE|nr:unnamed protein product [Timema genevievae]